MGPALSDVYTGGLSLVSHKTLWLGGLYQATSHPALLHLLVPLPGGLEGSRGAIGCAPRWKGLGRLG